MYDFIEDLKSSVKAFSKISKCEYVIGVEEGTTATENYTITNDNLLYILDNGSPRNGIVPHNLTTRFKNWFKSEIEPRMEEDLYDKIIDDDLDEKYIRIVFENYQPLVLNWYRNEIRKIKILDFNMNEFTNKIYCKIICKDI